MLRGERAFARGRDAAVGVAQLAARPTQVPANADAATRHPRVLLFCSRPRSDAGGMQGVMQAIESGLAQRDVPRLRIGPDEGETPATHRLWLAPPGSADGASRLAPGAVPRAALSTGRLALLMKRFRPDVVNVHFAHNAIEHFLLLRRIFGFRLILSLHGSDLFHPHPSIRRHLPRYLRECDVVTVVSDTMRDAARDLCGPSADIRVLPNGVDTRFWSPSGEVQDNRIVTAGRLVPVKGFDVLVEALARLPEARVDIYGEGEERAALEELARLRGVAERLRLHGHSDRETLRRAFRGAAAFAMPSRSEGMPLALLEAMSCGAPPVASSVGEVPRIVTSDSGWTVPPEDAGALAAALAEALSPDASARRRSARARVASFSSDSMVGRYLDLYGCAPLPAGDRAS